MRRGVLPVRRLRGESNTQDNAEQPATSHIHTPNFGITMCSDFTRKHNVLKPPVNWKEGTKETERIDKIAQ
ncbi:hypothetical protein AAFF_G00188770 [Aldrovandia affinis]|uniref:Uncharacterized protein n=1 Tax=Aldrovandia affinis TaxID=143900 RepID=A0AAD7SYC1_9TELE|nr:hypothetical protein AAFF_G00188770 [Aldrovandia affinis]